MVQRKQRNSTWDCPHIAQQITLAFGTEINKDMVRRILAAHYRLDPNLGTRDSQVFEFCGWPANGNSGDAVQQYRATFPVFILQITSAGVGSKAPPRLAPPSVPCRCKWPDGAPAQGRDLPRICFLSYLSHSLLSRFDDDLQSGPHITIRILL